MAKLARAIAKAALFASALSAGFGLAAATILLAAQATGMDVAYVEAVRGRVIATVSQGKPSLLDALDMVSDSTLLDLQANSELQICHFPTRRLLTLRGPLRALVSQSGVAAANGATIKGPVDDCAAPLVSTFQGGLVTRTTGVPTITVPLGAGIRVVNRGTQTIRRIVLWDGEHQTVLMNLDGKAARPTLEDGQFYQLSVERDDGSEFSLMLRARATAAAAPLIVVVR